MASWERAQRSKVEETSPVHCVLRETRSAVEDVAGQDRGHTARTERSGAEPVREVCVL